MSGTLGICIAQHVLRPLQHVGVLGALRAVQMIPAVLNARKAAQFTRSIASDTNHSSLYISDVDGEVINQTPLLLGLVNYFERHLPYVGYFAPIGGTASVDTNHPVDQHLRLIHDVFDLKHDVRQMVGLPEDEATRMIAAGKTADMLDRIYASYAAYKDMHDVVIVQATGVGTEEVEAQLAASLGCPAIITGRMGKHLGVADLHTQLVLKRHSLVDHKVPVLGAVVNKVPPSEQVIVSTQLARRCNESKLPLLGAIPEDAILRSVRLDEVQKALAAELLFASKLQLDQVFDTVQVATHKLEELLEILATDGTARPLVLTSVDRLDLVLGLLASQVSVAGPSVAGIVLTPAGNSRNTRTFARSQAERIFDGIRANTLFKGSLLPVMICNKAMVDVVRAIDRLHGTILPTSNRKIAECKVLFDKHVDANALVEGMQKHEAYTLAAGVMTPKMFMHGIKSKCLADPQKIVLPESNDPRVLTAASEVTHRGLAKITLLGDPDVVQAEAKKLGLDISKCSIVNPLKCDAFDKYVNGLVEARKKKGLPRDAAIDLLRDDVNAFGVMMVAMGDAGGMVSGACHTTAATIRPAMQVLRTPNLVSSCFFMCLPDKVLVYADCAVNVNPSSSDLAQIAIVSADTAAAFGIEPRVAMLSYSTMGSGAGPDVQKVIDAVSAAKAERADLKLEGPIQYDAAIDPAVAAVKIKTKTDVAGKATVFVFPDLNTGNNTYKAVQQASGAIAIGPVMQGLSKPVNDLSRGCTVPDIVNTICVTSVQAMQARSQQKEMLAAAGAFAAASA